MLCSKMISNQNACTVSANYDTLVLDTCRSYTLSDTTTSSIYIMYIVSSLCNRTLRYVEATYVHSYPVFLMLLSLFIFITSPMQ